MTDISLLLLESVLMSMNTIIITPIILFVYLAVSRLFSIKREMDS